MRKMKGLLAFLLAFILVGGSIPMPAHAATETAYFIMDYLNITQGMNNSYSHRGAYALDLAGKDGGRDVVYAPFTGVIKMIYSKNGNFIWLESVAPVSFADGTVDYMTIMIGHDNDISDLWVGKTIPQGTVFYQEGNAGNANGNHVHLEVARGKFRTGGWYENEYGNWVLHNAIPPYEALVLKSSTVRIQDYGYNWYTVIGGGGSTPTPTPPPAPTFSVKTTAVCDYTVTVPAGFKLVCYDSVTSQTPSAQYIAPQSSSYHVYCSTRYTMSDGSVRFKFVSGNGYTLYFALGSMTYTADHSFTQISNTATCSAGGTRTLRCTSCGDTKTESSAALGHSYGSEWIIDEPSSCGQAGSKSRHCTRCSAKTDVTAIPATGNHVFGAWEIVVSPTGNQNGLQIRTCLVCNKEKEAEIIVANCGDADGDGSITSTDARLALQYYAGKIGASDLSTAAADVDGDGSVTSTDARLILQKYAGKITAWP